MKKFLLPLLALATVSLLSSCSTTAQLGTISTRNIDYSATYAKGDKVLHSADVTLILFIPLQLNDQNVVEMIDMAMKKEGYEFMTDVKFTNSFIFTYIFNHFSLKIEGTGWKRADATRAQASSSEPEKLAFEVVRSASGVELQRVPFPR